MKHNTKILKAYELAMNGYSLEEIRSAMVLMFNMKFETAGRVAMKGRMMTMQFNEN